MNFQEKLSEPFKECDIEWRIQQHGWNNDKPWAMVLAYVDARAVMDRLDDVFGFDGWSDSYVHEKDGVMCTLAVRINDGWVTKMDGSPETQVEAFKGGISKALVRTAVKLGIGRYLYKLEVNFADCSLEKKNGYNKAYDSKLKKSYWWKPPTLPKWALPDFPDETIKKRYSLLLKQFYGLDIPQDIISEAKEMRRCEMLDAIKELETEIVDVEGANE